MYAKVFVNLKLLQIPYSDVTIKLNNENPTTNMQRKFSSKS